MAAARRATNGVEPAFENRARPPFGEVGLRTSRSVHRQMPRQLTSIIYQLFGGAEWRGRGEGAGGAAPLLKRRDAYPNCEAHRSARRRAAPTCPRRIAMR